MTAEKHPNVELYLEKATKWKEEVTILRELMLETGLTEDYKWMNPCYTLEGKNIVLIHCFKEYCALLFFKGSLLTDPHHYLVIQTENVQARRQLRFTKASEIVSMKSEILDFVQQAIDVEKSGKQVPMKTTKEFEMPEEFQQKLEESEALKEAFESLTPGRQRAYLLHFAGAKQSKTRLARVEKYIPHILNGKGLND
ncbi:YdeI/OmpD-associated family protein [Paenisporosarcina cavernae]|uniref:YdhG-like domain-containing protein n=1 Tax=Paenisporosarcina cavernae TaxID=2320858 RepID=A0A385YPV7_9BACL|nr:YdeI/OmpD-associated family protein [Paenisporosarcina cavernae]AYC28481.1 hypothetical protein D3873_00825 [Paenisporosarcina cavernae]